jgi:hypothetical protein
MSDERHEGRVRPDELLHLVRGEVAGERAEELRRRLAADPGGARRLRRLAAVWENLELPPASPPPPGFALRVMARVRRRSAAEAPLSWSAAPRWARAAGAAALAGGILAGVGVGLGPAAPSPIGGPAVAPPVRVVAAASPAATVAGGGAVSAPAAEPGTPVGGETPGTPSAESGATAGPGDERAAVEPPVELGDDAPLAAGYWAAVGLADDPGGEAADAAGEEPRS